MITSTQVCSYAFQCDDDAWDFSFWWFVWQSIATNHEFCIWLSHAVCDLHDCEMWNLHCFFTQNIAEPLFCQTSTVLFSLEQRGKISLAFVCNCVSGSPSSRLATCVKIGKKVIAIEHFFWKTHIIVFEGIYKIILKRCTHDLFSLLWYRLTVQMDSCWSIITCQEFGSSMNIQIHHWCCEDPLLRFIIDAVEDFSCVFPPFFSGLKLALVPLIATLFIYYLNW